MADRYISRPGDWKAGNRSQFSSEEDIKTASDFLDYERIRLLRVEKYQMSFVN